MSPILFLIALTIGVHGLNAADPASAKQPEARPDKEMKMSSIPDTLRALALQMQAADASPATVAEAIGPLSEPADGDDPLEVAPRDAAFASASVAHDEGAVQHLELQLADSAALPLATLSQAFGAYREVPRVSFQQPPRVAFAALSDPEKPFTVTLFAHVRPGAEGVKDGAVTAVTLRRDAR